MSFNVSEIIKNTVPAPPIPDITDHLAGFYASFGLKTPIARGVPTFALIYGLGTIFKIPYWFRPDGTVRPWSLISDDKDAVTVPLPLLSFIVGLFAAAL